MRPPDDHASAERAIPSDQYEPGQAIFHAALEGMLILDDDLHYVDANPAACAIIGRSREWLIGRTVGSLSADPAATRRKVEQALSTERPFGEGEITFPDGTVRKIEYTTRKNIFPGRHLIVTRDVTQRKRLEQQLLQSQKMEAIGQLAGGVAHDFNNMLTVIRGFCELLQRQLDPQSSQRRYADSIMAATEKATLTAQQLLAFSRRQVIQPREINLNSTVQDMGSLLPRLIGENIRLRLTLASDLGTVRLDPGQLSQILLNLVVNSRDAMPNGGNLTIETSNVVVDKSYAQTHLKVEPGPFVMLTVTDSGTGMAPATLARIFEPFFTTKAPGKGTGLGLSTVYGIIEQAHGAVYVYSEPGEGTCFKIYFPRVDQAALSDKEGLVHLGSAISILVIEDDREMLQLIGDALEAREFRVLRSSGGGEAVRLCEREKHPINLVVSDITMPGTDGLDIQGYIAIHHPEAKLIYTSGYTRKTLRERGVLPPDADFIQKPFRIEDLISMVEETLGQLGTESLPN